MVVDGTRTLAAGPARMDSELSHIAPGNVDSVEVVTGPYALAEGAGAMGAILVRSAEIPSRSARRLGGRLGTGWRSNGTGRMGQASIDAGNPAFGFSLRASGDLLDDYRAGRSGDVPAIRVPGDAATHQFGAKARLRPVIDQEILVSGFYDEQTGVEYPGRLLTAEHFLLRGWRASCRVAKWDGLLTALKLVAYLNKKSHRMSNRGKPTAVQMPGRRPPFALDVSLPAESDTVGGAGRVELTPSKFWSIQAGFAHSASNRTPSGSSFGRASGSCCSAMPFGREPSFGPPGRISLSGARSTRARFARRSGSIPYPPQPVAPATSSSSIPGLNSTARRPMGISAWPDATLLAAV